MLRQLSVKWRVALKQVVAPAVLELTAELAMQAQTGLQKAQEALRAAEAAVAEVRELRRHLTALQALDVGFKESGKVIILVRVGEQDHVRFLDIKPQMRPEEYRDLIEGLKSQFGVGNPVWIDTPQQMPAESLGLTPHPRTRRAVRA